VRQTWDELGTGEVFLWHKLITGGFRVGVAKGLVVRALARVAGVEESVMATRLAGAWEPSGPGFQRLLSGELTTDAASRPYPFFLASPLENSLRSLDPLADWMVEWKWDGVRAQMVKRPGTRLLWSRGEEVLSDAFPEVLDAARFLPDGTVLDGEVLPWKDGRPLTFSALQQRLNREHPSEALLREIPVIFLAYDLLEVDGKDLRERPLGERRARLVGSDSSGRERGG
jgi:DNA ligase-1